MFGGMRLHLDGGLAAVRALAEQPFVAPIWKRITLSRAEPPPVKILLIMACTALSLTILWEQLRFKLYRRGRKTNLPGPNWTVPLLGGIIEMVKDPHAFWERQRSYSFPGVSWNSILSKYTVFVTDAALSRFVFSHNSKDTLLLDLHPSAKMILGTQNIAFKHGPDHKALRKSFLALFTRKALGTYVQKQDAIIRRHLTQWLQMQQPLEIRPFIRDMNAFTSQEVFAGPYLDNEEERTKFSESYAAMTSAFLAFPLKFPGTAVWKGMKGRHFILSVLNRAAERSKRKMRDGHEPECLLDFWTLQILSEIDAAAEQEVPPPKYCANHEIAYTVMDFLFASQDASTSSLVFTITLMAEHPQILAKVREEQYRVRSNLDAIITGEALNEMPYTRQVIREVLRYRPPAPSVPQCAQRPFKLTDNYTVPKGTFLIPCIVSACKQGFQNPDAFDPDRFGPDRREDVRFAANFLTFGHGPHYCVGKEYAMNHLVAFLAIISTTLDWTRLRTKDSDWIKYLPTLYPYDSIFHFKSRPVPDSK